MSTSKRQKSKANLLQGTLDMLILQTLRLGPQHGHGIGQAIQTRSNDLLTIEAGSLYPALHRLERRGLLMSEWDLSGNNQRAKFYRLTPLGKKQLFDEESQWDLLVKAVSLVRKPI
jgi:transcriptional regulator